MSFYGHPFIIQQAPSGCQARNPNPNSTSASHSVTPLQPHQTQQRFAISDLENEERTALAYLRSVQRRREAAEAAAALESRQRAAAAARHEAAVRAAAEQQAALIAAARREKAMRATLEREREREEALAAALEQHRREEILTAIHAERTRQANAARAYQAAIEQYREQFRQAQAQAEQQRQQQQQQIKAQQAHARQCQQRRIQLEQQAQQQVAQAKARAQAQAADQANAQFNAAARARGCAASGCCMRTAPVPVVPTIPAVAKPGLNIPTLAHAPKSQAATVKDEEEEELNLAGINSLLGSLFGFHVAQEDLAALRAEQELEPTNDKPTADDKTADDKPAAETPAAADAKPEPDVTDKVTRDLEAFADAAEAVNANRSANAADETADPADTPLNAEAPEYVPIASASDNIRKDLKLPAELNQLLNAFLGLQVDPAADDEEAHGHGKVVGDAVVNLNDILGRYGLEFVPDDVEIVEPEPAEEPTTAAEPEVELPEEPQTTGYTVPAPEIESLPETPEASAGAAPEPVTADPVREFKSVPVVNIAQVPEFPAAPFTSTLDHHSNIPPHLRDILANVESAMNSLNEDEDAAPCGEDNCACDTETKAACNSGTPCAEPCHANGKKRVLNRKRRHPRDHKPRLQTEEPEAAEDSPERAAAFAKLDDIETRLQTLLSSFTFPANLGFAASTPDRTQPPLLFNRTNSPYHAQAHDLLQLILAADGVQSEGDRVIRRRRKELVSKIEAALGDLEARRDARWEEVRERRERGESDDDDQETSSTEITDSEPEVEGFELI